MESPTVIPLKKIILGPSLPLIFYLTRNYFPGADTISIDLQSAEMSNSKNESFISCKKKEKRAELADSVSYSHVPRVLRWSYAWKTEYIFSRVLEFAVFSVQTCKFHNCSFVVCKTVSLCRQRACFSHSINHMNACFYYSYIFPRWYPSPGSTRCWWGRHLQGGESDVVMKASSLFYMHTEWQEPSSPHHICQVYIFIPLWPSQNSF